MEKLRLVHWNQAEAEERAWRLRELGYDVEAGPPLPPLRRFAEGMRAVVIDLSRLPSQGRDVGVAVRVAKSTRSVPIVFVGGLPEKIERVRQTLPDATFTSWAQIGPTLRRVRPPRNPVVPSSGLAAYSSTPLPRKLGVREGAVVSLVSAPEGFERLLGEGAVLRRGNRGWRELTIVFAHKPGEITRLWDRLATDANVDDVWIVWAKKSSPAYAGITQAVVRELGLARGFVDFKVCAVDETWSGLRFKRRR